MVLNGRAPSDRTGKTTCFHMGVRTSLDLGLVPTGALADLTVLPLLRREGNWHTAVLRAVLLSTPAPEAEVIPATGRVQPAAVALTGEQLAAL